MRNDGFPTLHEEGHFDVGMVYISTELEYHPREGNGGDKNDLYTITFKNHNQVMMDAGTTDISRGEARARQVFQVKQALDPGAAEDIVLQFRGSYEGQALVKAFRWLADRIEANS